jgi:diadenosine tetraphosphate (Ap4A) HIT family hydrolase
VLWQNEVCRVVRVDEPDYPGFCRVILNRHAARWPTWQPQERDDLMRVVFAVEAAVRETLGAHKMNLASLGNMTPHVHWHVVPAFRGRPPLPRADLGGAEARGRGPRGAHRPRRRRGARAARKARLTMPATRPPLRDGAGFVDARTVPRVAGGLPLTNIPQAQYMVLEAVRAMGATRRSTRSSA